MLPEQRRREQHRQVGLRENGRIDLDELGVWVGRADRGDRFGDRALDEDGLVADDEGDRGYGGHGPIVARPTHRLR